MDILCLLLQTVLIGTLEHVFNRIFYMVYNEGVVGQPKRRYPSQIDLGVQPFPLFFAEFT